MARQIEEMIDVVFELVGETPAASYPFALWDKLLRRAPLMAEHELIGILPSRFAEGGEGMPLPKRAKLALRLPLTVADQIAALLSEQQIDLAGCRMQLGVGKRRPIQHYSTIHAQMVAGISDESLFMDDIRAQLSELKVSGNLICGKRHSLSNGQHSIQGFSLVIHDLKPDASLKLQYAGLGGSRQLGCGIFIPYKAISGLSDD